jgi:Family of unknown function (DUF6152)
MRKGLRRYGSFWFAGLAALLCGVAVQAHHWVNPRAGMPVAFAGKITFVSWDGPHVMYRIESENDQHEVKTWQVLGASPKILGMRSITKKTMKPGERVTVTGWLDPNSQMIAPEYFTTEDGHRYEMGFYPETMALPQAQPK